MPPELMDGMRLVPDNFGPLKHADASARFSGPCGDTMEIWIRVSEQRVREAGFTTNGCSSSRAAGSGATELTMGKPFTEAARIGQTEILTLLGGLPQKSEHCALLATSTLQAAIEDFCYSCLQLSADEAEHRR